jgi:Zn-finger nucleic acid-binding protein
MQLFVEREMLWDVSSFYTEIDMMNNRFTDNGYDQEDAYFHQKDAELLARKRAELDAQRQHSTVGKIKCSRCGSEMNEIAIEHVKVDRCTGCGGVFLDQGELEMLTHSKSGVFFKRIFGE